MSIVAETPGSNEPPSHRVDKGPLVGGPDERRQQLRRWFKDRAATLSPVYEGAIRIVEDREFPGRVVFTWHAIREIRNRLPEIIAGEIPGSSLTYRNLTVEIKSLWETEDKRGQPGISVDDGEEPTVDGSDGYPISIALYRAIVKLINGHSEIEVINQKKVATLFRELSGHPAPTYAVKSWLAMSRNAHKFAHVSVTPHDPSVDAELNDDFEKFENMLHVLANRSFENMDEVDELLDDANR